MVPLKTHSPSVFWQGFGVVTSWRAFLVMLKGMVVAMVAGAVVVGGAVVDGGVDPFDEQPATMLKTATVRAPQAPTPRDTGVALRRTGIGSL